MPRSSRAAVVEVDMPRTYESLSLEDAKRMLSAAEKKATGFGVAYNIAVVDAGANLVAFVLSLAAQDKIRHTTTSSSSNKSTNFSIG
jgi:uncharacterized protein GlcG (DUF336 family)